MYAAVSISLPQWLTWALLLPQPCLMDSWQCVSAVLNLFSFCCPSTTQTPVLVCHSRRTRQCKFLRTSPRSHPPVLGFLVPFLSYGKNQLHTRTPLLPSFFLWRFSPRLKGIFILLLSDWGNPCAVKGQSVTATAPRGCTRLYQTPTTTLAHHKNQPYTLMAVIGCYYFVILVHL